VGDLALGSEELVTGLCMISKALNDNNPIIVCTLQSFAAVYGSEHEVLDQTGKRFAIIVDEAHSSQHGKAAEDSFYPAQLVIAIETTPAFFGGLSELEDHRQRGLVRETSLGSHGPVAHRRERAFDDIGCTQMLPVFGRKVIEGKQCVSILDQTLGCPVVLDAPGFDEGIKCEQPSRSLAAPASPLIVGSSAAC
jgi:hypothetical protein